MKSATNNATVLVNRLIKIYTKLIVKSIPRGIKKNLFLWWIKFILYMKYNKRKISSTKKVALNCP